MPDKGPAWLIAAICGTVMLVGLVVSAAVLAVVGLLQIAMVVLRGFPRCEDCGRRFCVVEVKRDLTLEHKGVFEREHQY